MFDEENKAWCPTKAATNGSYGEYWGYCSQICPLDLKGTSNSIFVVTKEYSEITKFNHKALTI
jgi:hypothetical protein